MRCKNCGWPNKPNVTTCVKCNSPLTSEDDDLSAYDNGPVPVQEARPLNKTVREEDVFSNQQNSSASQYGPGKQTRMESGETPMPMSQCPKCGYPLRAGADKCPNCKFQISSASGSQQRQERAQNAAPINNDSHYRPTRMTGGGGSGEKPRNFRGTINPYMMNVETDPTFLLKPIKRMDERHDFNEQEYEGKEVVLNRDNTDPGNPSITSREQAVITNVDGRWYIEDKSDQKTTFVRAGEKIELHDGDIILLGNRMFEFHK